MLAATTTIVSAALALVASPPALAATPGTFTTLASSPAPVNNVAVDPATNIIYAQEFNGTGFYSYKPSTNTWTTLTSAPISQGDNGGGAYLDGKIYTVYTQNSSMGVYDIATNSWTQMTSPLGEGTGNITAYDGLLYLAVGRTLVSYNPSSGKTHSLASPPSFSSASFNPDLGGAPSYCPGNGIQPWGALAGYAGKLYATEGCAYDGFADYDIATNEWTDLSLLSIYPVLGGTVDPVTGTFYAYGSYGGSSLLAYNIADKHGTILSFPYSDLDDGGMAYVSAAGLRGVYATYGQESTGFTRLNTAYPVAVSLTETPLSKRIRKGRKFTYTLKVTNGDTGTAPDTVVTDKLPSKLKFTHFVTTAGTCSGRTTVTCSLGTLSSGETVTVELTVKAKKRGKATSTATLTTAYSNTSTATKATARVKIVK